MANKDCRTTPKARWPLYRSNETHPPTHPHTRTLLLHIFTISFFKRLQEQKRIRIYMVLPAAAQSYLGVLGTLRQRSCHLISVLSSLPFYEGILLPTRETKYIYNINMVGECDLCTFIKQDRHRPQQKHVPLQQDPLVSPLSLPWLLL